MSEATVSVLIPAYNAQATLEETIGSALSQTYQPLEILVVDDASTDSTADLVLALAKSNPMIKLLRAPQNAGLSAARNLGIREARGSWIALLDADDVWAIDKLAEQIKFAAGHSNLDVIGCYYQERFGDRLGAVRQELFWPSSLLIKRTVLLEVLFNPEWRSSEMPEFWSRFDLKYEKGGVTKPLMHYRLNLTGIAHRRFFKERMAWRVVGENTRRRRDGVPEIRYEEVETGTDKVTQRSGDGRMP